MVCTTTIEAVLLEDEQHALRDLLDATRRTDEQLSYGAFPLPSAEREQLRALLLRRAANNALVTSV